MSYPPAPCERRNDVFLNASRSLGGARRDRTDDLMLAKHALYQLSYGPNVGSQQGAVVVVRLSRELVGPGKLELPTSRLSGVRSNH